MEKIKVLAFIRKLICQDVFFPLQFDEGFLGFNWEFIVALSCALFFSNAETFAWGESWWESLSDQAYSEESGLWLLSVMSQMHSDGYLLILCNYIPQKNLILVLCLRHFSWFLFVSASVMSLSSTTSTRTCLSGLLKSCGVTTKHRCHSERKANHNFDDNWRSVSDQKQSITKTYTLILVFWGIRMFFMACYYTHLCGIKLKLLKLSMYEKVIVCIIFVFTVVQYSQPATFKTIQVNTVIQIQKR